MVFWCRRESVQVFVIVCLYINCRWRGEGWDPIIRFKPPTFVCLVQARTCIFNVIFRGLMRGACSFCWYYRNAWPSLFKLSILIMYRYDIIVFKKLIKNISLVQFPQCTPPVILLRQLNIYFLLKKKGMYKKTKENVKQHEIP